MLDHPHGQSQAPAPDELTKPIDLSAAVGSALSRLYQLAESAVQCPHESPAGRKDYAHCPDCGAVRVDDGAPWIPSIIARELARVVAAFKGSTTARLREWPIGLAKNACTPRDYAVIVAKPQMLFRGERLSVANECAEFFDVVDVKIRPYDPALRGENEDEALRGENEDDRAERIRAEVRTGKYREFRRTTFAEYVQGLPVPGLRLPMSQGVDASPLAASCMRADSLGVRMQLETMLPGDALEIIVYNRDAGRPRDFRALYYGTMVV
jgi:hypothetical protein